MSRKRKRKLPPRISTPDDVLAHQTGPTVQPIEAEVKQVDSALAKDRKSSRAANSESLTEHAPERKTEYTATDENTATAKNEVRGRKRFYLTVALAALAIIWLPALLFLLFSSPVYKSGWTIVIPGTTSGASINLDSLGEANTSTSSQYGSQSIDPKVNYKAIVLSTSVLDRAASMSDLSIDEFGDPKITLVDQTALMEVTTNAESAELSKLKAQNLYSAFMDQIEQLRSSERIIKQNDSLKQLSEYQLSVDKTRSAIHKFRSDSELVSVQQYKSLLDTVGRLTETKREADTRLAALNARFEALGSSLDMTPVVAAEVMKLRQDLMVQSQFQAYTSAHASMIEEEAILGRKHPKVVHARSRTNLAYRELIKRADEVLGRSSKSVLDNFMPNAAVVDTQLYTQLIQLNGDRLALESEISVLEENLPEMKARVLNYADEAGRLEKLERDHQIANTILTSASARLDLGKSDIYASYPMTQLLESPSVPEKPGRLQKLFVLLGALLGTMLVVLALVVVWNRNLWLRLIQKSA